MATDPTTRRNFLHVTSITGTGLLVAGVGCATLSGEKHKEPTKPEEDVSPAEDLMREHGVLKRMLLVYEESIRRIDANQDLPPDPVLDAAKIVHDFVENYHEKLEEDF